MSQFDLSTITDEPINQPPIILIYGEPGVGKTHFGVQAPHPIFLDIEGSAKREKVAKKETKTYAEFDGWLHAIETGEHQYKTLVIDTADWLEKIIHQQVCAETGAKSISDKNNAGTGYGNGHIKAVNMLEGFRVRLENLRSTRNMAIIILCHSKVQRIDEPDGGAYDRYVLKTHDKFAALLVEWVDAVLFLKKKTYLDENNKPIEGERVLVTCGTKAAVAKNRLYLPDTVLATWRDFVKAIGTTKPDTKETN